MSTAAKSFKAALAALVLVTAGGAGAVAVPAAAWAQPAAKPQVTPELRATFRKGIVDAGGPFMQELIDQFPKEYYAFETEMLEGFLAGTLTPELARRKGFEFSRGLTPRLYDGWQMAPDAEVLALGRLQLKTAREFAKQDKQLCAEFLEGSSGPATAGRGGPNTMALLNESNLAMVKLAKSGRVTKIKRPAVSEADLVRVATAFADGGGDPRWLIGVATGEFGGLDWAGRCDSALKWTETILGQDPALAARLLTTN
ncbi:MAG TPA: hypothetical protein VEA44_18135 [Caulobacter sp.]|nr:hypothetical protein [Caulobacter sp.]